MADLSRLPPIVTSWEVDQLKDHIARAQRGEAFVLQGGDCAETFDECTSENIVAKLKILLQMSLVMLYGMRKPVDSRRAHGGSIRETALGGHGNARRQDAAELSRRPGQSQRIHGCRACAGTAAHIARLRAGSADAEFCTLAHRWRVF